MSTPPVSPNPSLPSPHAPGRHHAIARPAASDLPTPITSTPPSSWQPTNRPPMRPMPYRVPLTPTSSSSHTEMHHPRPRPLPTTHHSAPFLASLADLDPTRVPSTLPIPLGILSQADVLSRSKIRSCHLATDHDCILRKYELSMRQQPVQARMCGVGEKCKSSHPHNIFTTGACHTTSLLHTCTCTRVIADPFSRPSTCRSYAHHPAQSD